jgi:rhodanese-related sulfurtransferase
VRADYEFEAGHVPGSLNLEFDLGDRTDLSPAKREAFEALAGQDRKRRLVLYCRSFR